MRTHRTFGRVSITLFDRHDDGFVFAMNRVGSPLYARSNRRGLKPTNLQQWIELAADDIGEPAIAATMGNLRMKVVIGCSRPEHAAQSFRSKALFKCGLAGAKLPGLVQGHVFGCLTTRHPFERLARAQQLLDVIDRKLNHAHARERSPLDKVTSLQGPDGFA